MATAADVTPAATTTAVAAAAAAVAGLDPWVVAITVAYTAATVTVNLPRHTGVKELWQAHEGRFFGKSPWASSILQTPGIPGTRSYRCVVHGRGLALLHCCVWVMYRCLHIFCRGRHSWRTLLVIAVLAARSSDGSEP